MNQVKNKLISDIQLVWKMKTKIYIVSSGR